jgi:hypothetical protein
LLKYFGTVGTTREIEVVEDLFSQNVWVQALVDNTAQGIYNELEKLRNLATIHKRRWIWELCQNAVDSAISKVAIEVELREQAVIFRHDGHPFEEAEIAHLIYHGSTKRGEGGKLGRWGTGFLTTHLLSRLTKVSGTAWDGRGFSFTLDRSGKNADAIRQSMEMSRKEFQQSHESGSILIAKAGFTTEYEYPLDQDSMSVARTGIEDLRKIAPYVLALNDEIGRIALVDRNDEQTLVKSASELAADGTCVIRVENKGVTKQGQGDHLWIVVVKDDTLTIGAELIEKDGSLRFADCSGIPKLFVAFPLYTTEDFSFPLVINCREFVPTSDRDGVFLAGEETTVNLQNKAYLSRAISLIPRLVACAINKGWLDVHLLVRFSEPPPRSWLDTKWYKELLRTSAVTQLMGSQVVYSKGKWICPKDALIPVPGDLDELWNLAAYLCEDRLPSKDLCSAWAGILGGWAALLDKKPEEFELSLTVHKLGEMISGLGSLGALDAKLKNGTTPAIQAIDWLNRFLQLLFATKQQQLLDNLSLLPDQNRMFKKRRDLRADQGIDETIKDVARTLGQDVRGRLLDPGIIEETKKLATPLSQEELLSELLTVVKQQAKADPSTVTFESGNVALFWWLVSHQRYDLLSSYPVFCRRANEKGKEDIAYLGGKEPMLAPVECWPEQSRGFAGLFPSEFVMSSKYWKESDYWNSLQTQNLALCGPIYFLPKSLGEDMLMDLLAFGERVNEEAEHHIEDVSLSDIAFLRLENRGIIDQVRGSKDRARLFIRFLLDFALDADNGAVEPTGLSCKCGATHRIYTSNWLWVLRTQKWIPVAKGKQEIPSSTNLAALLQNQPEILNKLVGSKPARFFNNLNVSVSDVMKSVIATDEETRLALDNATGRLYKSLKGNAKYLGDLAELIEAEPGILTELQRKIGEREKILNNQRIGAAVEKTFREIFEKPEFKQQGLKIERTGLGSDFAIEHDLIQDGQEQLVGIVKGDKRVLIELKTATEDYVRMTTTQGQTAVANQDHYALCVVPFGGEVSEAVIQTNSRFVLDIGKRLVDKVNKVNELEQKSAEVSSGGGDVAIEVSEGQVRFRISRQVWDRGKTLTEFLNYVKTALGLTAG